jgi:hypothetical protein
MPGVPGKGGRPPRPLEEKRRTGNPGHRRLPAEGSLAPVPPVELSVFELDPKATMERVLEVGVVWLGQTDAVALAMLRESLAERTTVRERAMAGSSEARKELRELDKQIIGQLSTLGFDPAARARLGVAEVKRASALESLIAKRKG